MRTPDEINRQIKLLLRYKEALPEFDLFGDSNWRIIDLKIKVLCGEFKNSEEIWKVAGFQFTVADITRITDVFKYLRGEIETLITWE